MQAQRRLGRGLEALLGGTTPAKPHLAIHQPDGQPSGEPLKVSVYEIDNNPYQPRKDFDEAEIGQLAESLEQHGLLQPIVVRRAGERYQLISGERRLRAAIKAGWPDVPVYVRECDDRRLAEFAIVENLQRKDLNPLEKAASFQLYLDQYDCTQEELAGRLAIDRSTVTNLLRLLELPTMVQAALRAGAISQGHARALLPLGDDHLHEDSDRRPERPRGGRDRQRDNRHRGRRGVRGTSCALQRRNGGRRRDGIPATSLANPRRADRLFRAGAAYVPGHQGGDQATQPRSRQDRDPLSHRGRI
jgi:ParB/RepB/Spo0J family partition protein